MVAAQDNGTTEDSAVAQMTGVVRVADPDVIESPLGHEECVYWEVRRGAWTETPSPRSNSASACRRTTWKRPRSASGTEASGSVALAKAKSRRAAAIRCSSASS